jgi:flagellin-like protein
MFRKGVSPVIATVLLIAMVFVLGAIVFVWSRSFLSESAVKNGKVVETSCDEVRFETQIVESASQCNNGNGGSYSAIDINNVGNIPIYGIKALKYDDSTGSIDDLALVDQSFESGTVKIGESSFACLQTMVSSGTKFKIIPKLLAERGTGKIVYTCPESNGLTVSYNG